MSNPAPEHFARWVHDAYNHLYDVHYLQSHPLGEWLAPAESNSHQRSQRLRRRLLAAIQSLRPPPGAPAQSPDWRLYSLLELRYIERLSPAEAMQQLSLAKSQFFRDQARAIELVTELLWREVSTQSQTAAPGTVAHLAPLGVPTVTANAEGVPVEFHATTWRHIHLGELLDELAPVLQPLTAAHQITIITHGLYELPPVRGDRVLLRQALLNVLTFAVTSTAAHTIAITGSQVAGRVTLRLNFAAAPLSTDANGATVGARLKLAAQVMEAMDGALSEVVSVEEHTISLTWSPVDQKTLLMIDDNEGLMNLFRRYLTGEPWQIVWAKNGAEARQQLASITPTVILLDIMMPEEDGWEILVELKQQAATRQTPVLICSVVNEPTLAASLGAAGYLVKPVSQEALRAALAPWQ